MKICTNFKRIGKHSDIRYLVPFFSFSQFLCLSPKYDGKHNRFVFSKYQRHFCIFLFVAFLVGYAVALPPRIRVYKSTSTSEAVFDMLSLITTTLVTTTSILNINFRNQQKFLGLLNNFLAVDAKLEQFHRRGEVRTLLFHLEVFVSEIPVFMAILNDLYVWNFTSTGGIYENYLIQDLQTYHMHVMVTAMYNLIVCLKYRFEILNVWLSGLHRDKLLLRDGTREMVFELGKIYTTLYGMISAVNEVYGVVILLIFFNTVTNFFVHFHVVILNSYNDIYGGIVFVPVAGWIASFTVSFPTKLYRYT